MKRGILVLGLSLALVGVGCGDTGGSTEQSRGARLYQASVSAIDDAAGNTDDEQCEEIEVPPLPGEEGGDVETIEICIPHPEDLICHEDFVACIDNSENGFDDPQCIEALNSCMEDLFGGEVPEPPSCEEMAQQLLHDTGDQLLADTTKEMCEFGELARQCDGMLTPDLVCEPWPELPPLPEGAPPTPPAPEGDLPAPPAPEGDPPAPPAPDGDLPPVPPL